jgi:hypothetical protein
MYTSTVRISNVGHIVCDIQVSKSAFERGNQPTYYDCKFV